MQPWSFVFYFQTNKKFFKPKCLCISYQWLFWSCHFCLRLSCLKKIQIKGWGKISFRSTSSLIFTSLLITQFYFYLTEMYKRLNQQLITNYATFLFGFVLGRNKFRSVLSFTKETNLILHEGIVGYRKGHSTTTALLKIRDDIIHAIKEGEWLPTRKHSIP